MKSIQLAAFDVDGTLTLDETITDAVQRAIDSLREQNVEVVISTGRSLSEVDSLRTRFPWIRYYILSNGACIWDDETCTWVYEDLLPIGTARALYRALEGLDMLIELYADGKIYANACFEKDLNYYHAHFLEDNLPGSRTSVPDLWQFLKEREAGIEKFNMFFHDAKTLKRAHTICTQPGVSLIVSLHQSLEANSVSSSKGKALKSLCEQLKIDLDDTAALGDGAGDISMFQHVGLPIAMGNAPDEVKSHARIVVPRCDADGAAYAIHHYILGEGITL